MIKQHTTIENIFNSLPLKTKNIHDFITKIVRLVIDEKQIKALVLCRDDNHMELNDARTFVNSLLSINKRILYEQSLEFLKGQNNVSK